jgi:glutamate racemase
VNKLSDNKSPIGIFDSGMGGVSVLGEAIIQLKNEEFVYFGDSKNAPYGSKTKEEVVKYCIDICDYFVNDYGVKSIVIACNTATSAAVDIIRTKYDIPIIGIEPALKPAVENTKCGSVVVMATEMTLKEKKFNNLMMEYGKKNVIVKLPCPNLVTLVEDGITEGEEAIEAISKCFYGVDLDKIESVVLGCTHFIFLRNAIDKFFNGKVKLFDGNYGTVKNLKNKLEMRNLLNEKNKKSEEKKCIIINSGGENLVRRSKELFKKYKSLGAQNHM